MALAHHNLLQAETQRRPHLPRPHLVVVGNGMAAMRTVEELLALTAEQYRITVFGAEPHGNYNRIMLSAVLAGDTGMEEIVTHPLPWYAEHGITLHAGDPVEAIDADLRTVTSTKGVVVAWDRLILATGARPLMPAIPGMGLDGVCAFRDMKDVVTMLDAARQHQRAVVIGGGVLGLEAAWGLTQQGMEVAVVHMMPSLMERQLDHTAATLLRRDVEQRGIACITAAQASAIIGEDRVEGVQLSDGRLVAADLVVVAVGIRPEVELARQAGLEVGRGVVVGNDMRTSSPHIFAVGECVEHAGQCYGLVMPLWEMARVCAHHLAGTSERQFIAPAVSARLKIPGIDLFSAGETIANDHDREIVHHDTDQGIYKKLILRDGRVVGAVMYGDVSDSAQFWQWMRQGTDVSHLRTNSLCLGRISGLSGAGGDVAEMADDSIVCHCNQVTKGALVAAIATHNLTTLEQVSRHTKAGSGCGQCTALTARILAHSLGHEVTVDVTRTERMRRGFTLWHRTNAVLMVALVLTGLALHFPLSGINLLGFEWSHMVHKWSGLAVCVAYLGFVGLTVAFKRQWRADVDGMTMFAVLPLVGTSGLAFLWPALMPDRLGGVAGVTWVALGHAGLAVLVLMYLIHHLSHAPWVWWEKRKLRTIGG